jgi:CRP/FNR family transcriptional regulator
MDRPGRADVIPREGFLAELPGDLRAQLAAATHRRELGPGEVLALEGDPCLGLFVVSTGLIKVSKVSPEGREQVLLLVRPGETFADAPAFTGQPMPACVVAVEKSSVLVVSAATLNRLIDEDRRFARAVIQHLCRKLQHVVHVVEDLSFLHVRARVAKILLQQLQPREGVGAGVGGHALTQQEIAELAGTAREVVSRALAALEEAGFVRTERGKIVLLDPGGLAVLLGDQIPRVDFSHRTGGPSRPMIESNLDLGNGGT